MFLTLYSCSAKSTCSLKKSIVDKQNRTNRIRFSCCYKDNCFVPDGAQNKSAILNTGSNSTILFIIFSVFFWFNHLKFYLIENFY
jgi:hypothetical protein